MQIHKLYLSFACPHLNIHRCTSHFNALIIEFQVPLYKLEQLNC